MVVRGWFLLIILLLSFPSWGQMRCGNMGSIDPAFEARISALQAQPTASSRVAEELEIAVMIHVLLAEDIEMSDDQIFSQMDVTNEHYSGNFKFSLKTVDRTVTSERFGFNSLDEVIDLVPEVPDVLNIWIVDLQQGFLGAASFPWSLAVPGLDSSTLEVGTFPLGSRGLIVDYSVFGVGDEYNLNSRFDLGKTVTHEIGHFLGLHHPWGIEQDCDLDDYCSDTGLQGNIVFSGTGSANDPTCPTSMVSDCDASQDLALSNYMQFLDDPCLVAFTPCQLERMRIVTETNLTNLLNSSALDLPDYRLITAIDEPLSDPVAIYPNPSQGGRFQVEPAGRPLTIFDLSGKRVFEGKTGSVNLGYGGLFIATIEVSPGKIETFKIFSR